MYVWRLSCQASVGLKEITQSSASARCHQLHAGANTQRNNEESSSTMRHAGANTQRGKLKQTSPCRHTKNIIQLPQRTHNSKERKYIYNLRILIFNRQCTVRADTRLCKTLLRYLLNAACRSRCMHKAATFTKLPFVKHSLLKFYTTYRHEGVRSSCPYGHKNLLSPRPSIVSSQSESSPMHGHWLP